MQQDAKDIRQTKDFSLFENNLALLHLFFKNSFKQYQNYENEFSLFLCLLDKLHTHQHPYSCFLTRFLDIIKTHYIPFQKDFDIFLTQTCIQFNQILQTETLQVRIHQENDAGGNIPIVYATKMLFEKLCKNDQELALLIIQKVCIQVKDLSNMYLSYMSCYLIFQLYPQMASQEMTYTHEEFLNTFPKVLKNENIFNEVQIQKLFTYLDKANTGSIVMKDIKKYKNFVLKPTKIKQNCVQISKCQLLSAMVALYDSFKTEEIKQLQECKEYKHLKYMQFQQFKTLVLKFNADVPYSNLRYMFEEGEAIGNQLSILRRNIVQYLVLREGFLAQRKWPVSFDEY